MATKRQSIHSSGSKLNFRPPTSSGSSKWEPRGTKPTRPPTSVNEIFVLMVLYLCKKSIFFDTNLKVALYLGALFLISLISDFVSMPKMYMSRSDNVFNQYFVKFAWGWNLTLLVPFVLLSSYVYCCGQKDKILRCHAPRIAIATFFWFFWTKLFNIIEASYGRCNVKGDAFNSKQACLKGGYFWNGFDLSGHSFILIYGSLVLIEEAKIVIGWESIRDFVRDEDHYRSTKDNSLSTNPLRYLSDEEFKHLQNTYEKFTVYIRGLFIAMTAMQILWDIMLVCTMLYYHIMIEKFLGGAVAILTWFFTYRFWYVHPKILPGLPGDGLFKYVKNKPVLQNVPVARKRAGSITNGSQIPKFMGMPLYNYYRTETGENSEAQIDR